MKYLGHLDDLKALIDTLPIDGEWEPEPSGVAMFRCSTGAIMHFSTTTHRVWFNGNAEASADLQDLIIERLLANATKAKLPAGQRLIGSENLATTAASKTSKTLRVVRKLHRGR